MKLFNYAILILPLFGCKGKKAEPKLDVAIPADSVIMEVQPKELLKGATIAFDVFTLTFINAEKGESPRVNPVSPQSDSVHIGWDENCFAELCGNQSAFEIQISKTLDLVLGEINAQVYYSYFVSEDGSGGLPRLDGFAEVSGQVNTLNQNEERVVLNVPTEIEKSVIEMAEKHLKDKNLKTETEKITLKASAIKVSINYSNGSAGTEMKSKDVWIHLNYGD